METERIEFKKIKRQIWWEQRRRDLESFKDKAVEFGMKAWDHKGEIIAAATAATGVVVKAKRMHDDYIAEREIYDPSLHKTLRLKRRLTTRQKRELQQRFDSGEKIHDIIVDMGILK